MFYTLLAISKKSTMYLIVKDQVLEELSFGNIYQTIISQILLCMDKQFKTFAFIYFFNEFDSATFVRR